MALQAAEHLKEENRVLKNELERLEELLVVSRAERDQIGIRYNAISERVSSWLCNPFQSALTDETLSTALSYMCFALRVENSYCL